MTITTDPELREIENQIELLENQCIEISVIAESQIFGIMETIQWLKAKYQSKLAHQVPDVLEIEMV